MKHTGYFVKFNNFAMHPSGTGRLHIDVLAKHSQVIWGQWRNGANLLNEKIRIEMNEVAPFDFYALDKNVALLKMHTTRVLTKEEVIAENLEYLIPEYYDIDTPCSAYYLIDKIEILPPISATKVINVNTNRAIYEAAQVNSTTPWRVKEIDEDLGIENVVIAAAPPSRFKSAPPVAVKAPIATNEKYSVYRYFSKTTKKCYIGLTNDINRRRKEHENPGSWAREKKKYLYTAMQLMGLEDFEFSILHTDLTEEEAHYWEAQEIEIHNSYFPNGLNERNESRYLRK